MELVSKTKKKNIKKTNKKYKNRRKNKNIKNRRIAVILVSCILTSSALIVRLGYIMTAKQKVYASMANEQWTSEVKISAKRGRILDSEGNELAVSTNVYRVDLDLNTLRRYMTTMKLNSDYVANVLSEALDMSYDDILKKIELKLSSGIPANSATLARQIEKEKADKVKELSLTGVVVSSDVKRYYPNNSLLSKVLGVVNSEGVGITGIESYYNTYLSGTPGILITQVDKINNEIPYESSKVTEAIDGKDISLTINSKIQYICEEIAMDTIKEQNADGVTIIVTNPNNGEIIAMANKPDFDSNSPYEISGSFRGATESEMIQNMWSNDSISFSFEPGSIFKSLLGAAAIEEGIIGENETYTCNGGLNIGGTYVKCWKEGGHGIQTYAQTLQNSCNVATMEIASSLGSETLNNYLKKFGLGTLSGIDLPGEVSGVIKDTDKISNLDLGTISFGQTNTVNPIQFMTALNSVINGGNLIKPHIMKNIGHVDEASGISVIDKEFELEIEEDIISEETSQKMKEYLRSVVTEGSSKGVEVSGLEIAGKTGTAEKIDESTGTYGGGYVSSFVGFAPYDNPVVSIMVMIDNPKSGEHFGGVIATPVAKKVFETMSDYIENTVLNSKNSVNYVIMPNIIGKNVEKAKKILEDLNIQFTVEGDGGKIGNVSPKPGSLISSDSKIIVETTNSLSYNNSVVMPDLTGYSKEEAKNILSSLGLRSYFKGGKTGIIKEQNIASGEYLDTNSYVKLTLE
ncbi:MAG: stage V sporulation protein D [Clostridium perfringens]|nr:stage V sporulation protein D [Clostridium perfringens]